MVTEKLKFCIQNIKCDNIKNMYQRDKIKDENKYKNMGKYTHTNKVYKQVKNGFGISIC